MPKGNAQPGLAYQGETGADAYGARGGCTSPGWRKERRQGVAGPDALVARHGAGKESSSRGWYHRSMPKATTVKPDAELFGAIIQRLRLERGWTLRTFAQRSGKNATHLGVLEKGRNTPSLTTIFEMADLFNVPATELIREVEEARRERLALLAKIRADRVRARAGVAIEE